MRKGKTIKIVMYFQHKGKMWIGQINFKRWSHLLWCKIHLDFAIS